MNVNLSDKEREFLKLLLNVGEAFIDSNGGDIELVNHEFFDRNDLFNLKDQLGFID